MQYSNSLNFPNLDVKATPALADVIMIADSVANFVPKQATLNSLPFAVSPGSNVVNVTTATQAMDVNTIYFVNYAGGACTLTLPLAADADLGSYIEIRGGESAVAPWVIDQNANQFIRDLTSVTTTTSGTLTADNEFNSVRIECSNNNGLSWTVVNQNGSFTGA